MKKRYLAVGLLILVALVPVGLVAESFGEFKGVEFKSCYDGDTCKFNIPGVHPVIGQNISVRLDGKLVFIAQQVGPDPRYKGCVEIVETIKSVGEVDRL